MSSLGPVRNITLHHSATNLDTTAAQIEEAHLARGWEGVGYHFLVEASGRICIGRPIHLQGAHVRGRNYSNVGICAIGDNTVAGQEWRPAQLIALRELCHAITLICDLEMADILGHREWEGARTLCPAIDVSTVLGF